MKIIYNSIIPFKGFKAINICGVIFARRGSFISETTKRHESIHTRQQIELLVIGFFAWYVIEWLVRVLFSKDRFSINAYYSISFEREAYAFERDQDYLARRYWYSWIFFI